MKTKEKIISAPLLRSCSVRKGILLCGILLLTTVLSLKTCLAASSYETRSRDASEEMDTTYCEHEWEVTDSQAATCGAKGYIVKKCSKCNEIAAEIIQPTGDHTYGWVHLRQPTCTMPGEQVHKCTVCGCLYPDGCLGYNGGAIPALGHVWTVTSSKPSTETEEGYKKLKCQRCGITTTDSALDGGQCDHRLQWITVQEATCKQPTINEQRCSLCGYLSAHETIWGDGHFRNPQIIVRVESTCTTNGYVILKCTRCSEIKTEQLPLAKHEYDWIATSHPTATLAGSAECHCIVCGNVQTKDLYCFSFDACDGQGDVPAPQEEVSEAEVRIPKTSLSRDGYWFLGWATAKDAKTAQYKSGDTLTITANTTLFAVWKPRTWALSFDLNGGDGKLPTSVKATTGNSATIGKASVSRVGCYFLGWSESPTATEATYKTGSRVVLTSDKVLYAVWKKKLVKLTFDANNGTGTLPSAKNVSFGGTASVGKCSLTREGYWFLGWATTDDARVPQYKSGSPITITEDTVLFAVWKKK